MSETPPAVQPESKFTLDGQPVEFPKPKAAKGQQIAEWVAEIAVDIDKHWLGFHQYSQEIQRQGQLQSVEAVEEEIAFHRALMENTKLKKVERAQAELEVEALERLKKLYPADEFGLMRIPTQVGEKDVLAYWLPIVLERAASRIPALIALMLADNLEVSQAWVAGTLERLVHERAGEILALAEPEEMDRLRDEAFALALQCLPHEVLGRVINYGNWIAENEEKKEGKVGPLGITGEGSNSSEPSAPTGSKPST